MKVDFRSKVNILARGGGLSWAVFFGEKGRLLGATAILLAMTVGVQAQVPRKAIPRKQAITTAPPCQIALLQDPDTGADGSHTVGVYVVYVGNPKPGIPTYAFSPGVATWSWGFWYNNPFHIWLGPVAEGRYTITATVPCGASASATFDLQGF